MSREQYEELQRTFRKVLVPCEICDSRDLKLFQAYGRVAEPGVYGALPIHICMACGHKMQNPRYEDAFYKAYYEVMYREIAFGAREPSAEYIQQQKRRGAGVLGYAERHGIRPGRMLDHGCASGATMLAWIDAGWSCTGIDPHRPSVEEGRRLGLDITVGAGEEMPLGDASFDLVLSLGSLEHSYDLTRSLTEIRRVLKPGGHLVIRWRSNVIFGSPLEYYNHNHYRFFTPRTWRLALVQHGFDIRSTTDERLEGWDSYAYIIARRGSEPAAEAVARLIAAGEGENAEAELAGIARLRAGYLERCKRFHELHERLGDDPHAVIDAARKDPAGLAWGFLGGEAADVVRRSRMEVDRYLAEHAAGRIG